MTSTKLSWNKSMMSSEISTKWSRESTTRRDKELLMLLAEQQESTIRECMRSAGGKIYSWKQGALYLNLHRTRRQKFTNIWCWTCSCSKNLTKKNWPICLQGSKFVPSFSEKSTSSRKRSSDTPPPTTIARKSPRPECSEVDLVVILSCYKSVFVTWIWSWQWSLCFCRS